MVLSNAEYHSGCGVRVCLSVHSDKSCGFAVKIFGEGKHHALLINGAKYRGKMGALPDPCRISWSPDRQTDRHAYYNTPATYRGGCTGCSSQQVDFNPM